MKAKHNAKLQVSDNMVCELLYYSMGTKHLQHRLLMHHDALQQMPSAG